MLHMEALHLDRHSSYHVCARYCWWSISVNYQAVPTIILCPPFAPEVLHISSKSHAFQAMVITHCTPVKPIAYSAVPLAPKRPGETMSMTAPYDWDSLKSSLNKTSVLKKNLRALSLTSPATDASAGACRGRSLLRPGVSGFRTLSNTSGVNGLLFKNKANSSRTTIRDGVKAHFVTGSGGGCDVSEAIRLLH